MTRRFFSLIFVLCLGSGTGAFVLASRSAAPASTDDPVAAVLQLSPEQSTAIAQDDPNFDAESTMLAADLRQQRQKLAELLQSPDLQDAAVKAQLDRVLAADAALEHRVIDHVLAMRQRLTPAQRQQLMALCTQGMRGPMNGGRGMGPGMSSGMGRGMGPMYRGGRGPGATATPPN
jgi:uncharacterized membrane protein